MRTDQPFQALIFDAGGVFVPHDNEVLFQRLVARCTAADAIERLRVVHYDPKLGSGEVPVSEVHRRLQSELGYAGDWATFLEDWSCHLALDQHMLGLMTALAASNRVAIFSNTNHEHWTHVTRLSRGALDPFEIYVSHEIGRVKPDVEAFRRVATRAKVDPGRCLFIDDVLENVEGARSAGFQAEQFTGQGRLEALLADRGVHWDRRKQEAYP